MKLNLSKQDREKLDFLFETRDINMEIADLLNYLCFEKPESHKKEFDELSFLDKNSASYQVATNLLDLDSGDEKIEKFLSNSFSVIDARQYVENPYFKLFGDMNIRKGNYSLTFLKYEPYSFFPLDEINVYENDFYREESNIATFEKEYKYLSLLKNNTIWMCITPNEINTMKPYIEKAKGNVLVVGLGLGYFAYMASLKPEVKSITIIEKEKEIIDLFEQFLLPHFSMKNKIKIVSEDAYKVMSKKFVNNFDFTFIDIWHNAEDGLPMYLKFVKTLGYQNNICYWLEESMICLYRRCILILMEEQLNNLGDSSYSKSKNDFDKIINDLYFKTKNKFFNNFQEINSYLQKENIKKIILD